MRVTWGVAPGSANATRISVDDVPDVRHFGQVDDWYATSEWNDVRLECAVADVGHPRAALRWAVNGRPVEDAAEDADANLRCSQKSVVHGRALSTPLFICLW